MDICFALTKKAFSLLRWVSLQVFIFKSALYQLTNAFEGRVPNGNTHYSFLQPISFFMHLSCLRAIYHFPIRSTRSDYYRYFALYCKGVREIIPRIPCKFHDTKQWIKRCSEQYSMKSDMVELDGNDSLSTELNCHDHDMIVIG